MSVLDLSINERVREADSDDPLHYRFDHVSQLWRVVVRCLNTLKSTVRSHS